METRPIKELLILMRDNIDLLAYDDGLCFLSQRLFFRGKINRQGFDDVTEYLEDNSPTRRYGRDINFWWKPGNKEPRIKWLDKQIAKL